MHTITRNDLERKLHAATNGSLKLVYCNQHTEIQNFEGHSVASYSESKALSAFIDGLTAASELFHFTPIRTIKIEVENGVVTDVTNLPNGWDYKLVDHDVIDSEAPEHRLHHDVNGWYFVQPGEEEPEDGSSLGFDGRPHFASFDEALTSLRGNKEDL